MNLWNRLRSRIKALFRPESLHRELDEELRFHSEMQERANLETGMPPDEAHYAALRTLGNRTGIRETICEQRSWIWLEQFVQDARYAARAFRKSPAFVAVAILSLAPGIGLNTAIFSFLNALLLRPLPVENPGDLRTVLWSGQNVQVSFFRGSGGREITGGGRVSASFPYATYCDFRDQGTGFSELFAFSPLPGCTVGTRQGAVIADGLMVSGNFFAGFGADALIGRALVPADDRPAAPPAAVITHRFWQRNFGLDRSAVGEVVSINKVSFTIVGITGPEYVGPLIGDSADFYVPMSAQPELMPEFSLASYHHWWVEIMGRRIPGADERQSQVILEGLFKRTLEAPGGKTRMDHPAILLEDGGRGQMLMRERLAQPVYILLGGVSLVLLVACVNLAGLMLARGAARRHEFAVRAATGAGRWRLVRQSLTESLVLALGGGVLGLVLSVCGNRIIMRALSPYLASFHLDVRTDVRVLLFNFGLSVLAVLFFGLLPALRGTNVNPSAGLKDGRATTGPRLRLGKAVLVVQVGLSLVLVVATVLLSQTLTNLSRIDPGFDPKNLLVFGIDAGHAGYKGPQRWDFYQRLGKSLASLPGVRAVAFSDLALLGGSSTVSGVKIPGRPVLPDDVGQLIVSDSFFTTIGIPMVLGRQLDARDTARAAPRATVVNQSFARVYFPGENPIGRSVMIGPHEYEIVGICRDTSVENLRELAAPVMFRSFRQENPSSVFFEIRASLPMASLVPAVRRKVAELDGNIPLTGLRTQEEQINQSLTPGRIISALCGSLAALAVLLSCIGIHGVMAYGVARRKGEIGVRMALGARPRAVARSVVVDALIIVGVGVALGAVFAVIVGQAVRAQLYGVAPHDPVILGGAALLLFAVAAIAAWVPARRAARVDPILALRAE